MAKIQVETTVAVPAQKAWDCFTKPEHITKWNFASPDWHCPTASSDLKVGGKYSARMEAKDGSFGFDFTAVYSEVSAPRKVTYAMDDGREASTTFETSGNATKVTTTFDAEATNPIEMQKQGWQAILNNFKSYTEKA